LLLPMMPLLVVMRPMEAITGKARITSMIRSISGHQASRDTGSAAENRSSR
jgi:hypothetical protein